MDKLDVNLIERIEVVLGFKFEEWQKNYMLDIPMLLDMRITGRRTGKTLIYIIKLLFADDEPLRNYDIIRYADDWNVNDQYKSVRRESNYTRFFREQVRDIYDLLIMGCISPRQIFTRDGSKHNEERDIYANFKPDFSLAIWKKD